LGFNRWDTFKLERFIETENSRSYPGQLSGKRSEGKTGGHRLRNTIVTVRGRKISGGRGLRAKTKGGRGGEKRGAMAGYNQKKGLKQALGRRSADGRESGVTNAKGKSPDSGETWGIFWAKKKGESRNRNATMGDKKSIRGGAGQTCRENIGPQTTKRCWGIEVGGRESSMVQLNH